MRKQNPIPVILRRCSQLRIPLVEKMAPPLTVIALVLCCTFALVQAAVLPTLPTSWTSTISANFHNPSPANFYTLAYTESFDLASNTYVTRGRFSDSQQVDAFFFDSDVVFSYNARAPDSTCKFSSWASYPASRMVRPSVHMFDLFNNGSLTYVGTSLEARNIMCDKWNFTQTSPFNNHSYVYSIYFTVPVLGMGQIPVRVALTGTNTTGHVVVAHTYDWTNWQSGAPPKSVYTLPPNCFQAAPPRRLPLPHNNSLVDNASPSVSIPATPVQFTVTLEGKLNVNPSGSSQADDGVYTVVWSADTQQNSERFDIYQHSDPNDRSSAVMVDTYLFQYTPGTAWGTSGTRFHALLTPNATSYSGCSTASVSTALKSDSPLHGLRAGSLSSILTQLSEFYAGAPATYVGRSTARGVSADTYQSYHSTVNQGVSYQYTTSMLLFPANWSFPGRSITEDSRVPLRILNSGNLTNATGTFPYVDTWDLYFFVPGAPLSGRLDPVSLKCENYLPPVNPQSGYSQTTVIVAAVFGVVFGATFVAVLAWFVYRRCYAPSANAVPPMQLVEQI